MLNSYTVKLFLVVFVLLAATVAQDDEGTEDENSWLVVVEELGGTVTLDCDMNIYPNGSEPTAWMLPDFTILYTNATDGRLVIGEFLNNLTIINVTREDFGLYHCMMTLNDTGNELIYMNRLGLNLQGPYFEDLLEKYETNIIIGMSAFGGFLLLALMTVCAWQNRWELKEKTEESMETGNGEANFAYMEDEKTTKL